tara:strand:+ start:32514 stop:32753 length:240 start_codon:yes stop_codon:yes gene_type:complete
VNNLEKCAQEQNNPNGWNEWSKYVLKELERLNGAYTILDGKLDEIIKDVSTLKVKAGMWGAIAGMIPVAVALAIIYLGR